MKTAVLLSILLLTPNNSYTNKQSPTSGSPTGAINAAEIDLRKQEEINSTKIRLALIAAVVTIIIMYCRGTLGIADAIAFDQMIMDLSKK